MPAREPTAPATPRDLGRIIRHRCPGLELKQPHLEPVGTRAYVRWLLRYVLTQPTHHGLPDHPALWTGSCFQDLVGARLLPGFDAKGLGGELPRLRSRELHESLDLPLTELRPSQDEELRRAGTAKLIEPAAGVHCVGPDLRGAPRSKGVAAARSLACRAATLASLPPSELAHYLGVLPRAVRRLGLRPVDREAMHALRIRLTLDRLARRPTDHHRRVRQ